MELTQKVVGGAAAAAPGSDGVQYTVDLGAHPPYHPPPDGFRMSSDSSSDADSSMTSGLTTGGITSTVTPVDHNLHDRNMNLP